MSKEYSMSISELTGGEQSRFDQNSKNINDNLHVCMPGVIKSFNSAEMTVSVQPCIKETLVDSSSNDVAMEYPIIVDVPIYFSSSTKYAITFPVSVDDECLLFFADSCIDSWWQSGGIQSQFEYRRHDLSDCFCVPSKLSQPNKIQQFNTNYLEIKNNVSGVKIEVRDNDILVDGVDVKQLKQDFDQLKSKYLRHHHTTVIDEVGYNSSTPKE